MMTDRLVTRFVDQSIDDGNDVHDSNCRPHALDEMDADDDDDDDDDEDDDNDDDDGGSATTAMATAATVSMGSMTAQDTVAPLRHSATTTTRNAASAPTTALSPVPARLPPP